MSEATNPFYRGGLRTMVRAHLLYGLAGIIIGLIAAIAMVYTGPEWMRASPLFTVIAFALVFGIGTSMAGGLLHLTSGTYAEPARDDGIASRDS